jgi:hypothetical protein
MNAATKEARRIMKVVIDRFEGNYAICEKEDRNMMDIEINKLPLGAKVGDVLEILNNKISINTADTEKKKREIEELTKDLWS